jgi:hypothetical protein
MSGNRDDETDPQIHRIFLNDHNYDILKSYDWQKNFKKRAYNYSTQIYGIIYEIIFI